MNASESSYPESLYCVDALTSDYEKVLLRAVLRRAVVCGMSERARVYADYGDDQKLTLHTSDARHLSEVWARLNF